MSSKTKFAIHTLGCRANQYQSFGLVNLQLTTNNEQLVEFGEPADVYIINTCTVTADADKKSRNAIRRALKLAKKVIVTGCYARLKGKELKELFPEIHLTPSPPIDLTTYQPLPAGRQGNYLTPKIRENLMIEDGCDNFCSYCIVPYARGKVQRKSAANILKEAKAMVEAGVREIVLTGINLGAWGELSPLLTKMSEIENLARIRLSSIEPQYVSDKLLQTIVENKKVCRHLHIPLQSGDDFILNAMNRQYLTKDYLKLIEKINNLIPDCGITTDIIVGFPGEGEAEFRNTVDFLEKARFSRIHIFTFSRRDLTAASNFPYQVDAKTKKERYAILNKLRSKYMERFAEKYLGKEVEILVEQKGEGLTSNYIRVRFDDPIDSSGKLCKMFIKQDNIILD